MLGVLSGVGEGGDVEKRNALVHVGRAEVSEDWLANLIREVRCHLDVLDYHSGHEWAPKVAERTALWGRDSYAKADAPFEG